MISYGYVLKPRLPLVAEPGIFLQHCPYLFDGPWVLLLEDLIGEHPRAYMAGMFQALAVTASVEQARIARHVTGLISVMDVST